MWYRLLLEGPTSSRDNQGLDGGLLGSDDTEKPEISSSLRSSSADDFGRLPAVEKLADFSCFSEDLG